MQLSTDQKVGGSSPSDRAEPFIVASIEGNRGAADPTMGFIVGASGGTQTTLPA